MFKVEATDRSAALGLSLSVFLLCAGCASDGVKEQAAYDRKIQRTEQRLILAGDADSLAAAALLSVGTKVDADSLNLIARAVVQAPDRPDLAWFNLRFCSQVDGCDPQPLAARLQALDSANGAVWSDSITRAGKRNDVGAVRNGLEAIASSTRFDTYWNVTIVRTTNAIFETRTMSLRDALHTAMALASALTLPPYHSVLDACKDKSLREPDVMETCRRVASVMRRGDTYITEMIGLAMAMRAWPEGSAEYSEAVMAKRVARYRMETDGTVGRHHPESPRFIARRLRWMTEKGTEQDVILTEILDAKLNPNPPSEWTDR